MKEKVITIGGIIFVVLTLAVSAGLTYSFFTASVGGNEQARETVVDLAELRLKFTDTQNIQMIDALPGQAVTKTFTVENRGDVEIEYTIDIEILTNTFVNNELVYSLTSTNGGATATRKAIPTTSGTLETATIAPGVTQTYTMTVLFKETGSNQNSNMGAIFGGVLQINSNGQYKYTKPSVANILFDFDTAQSDAGISFESTSESDGTVGLYYTSDTTKTENGEVVYYYRGAVTNNYVVFGTYQNEIKEIRGYLDEYDKEDGVFNVYTTIEECGDDGNEICEEVTLANAGDPMCWRIVRTVEDGSVRLRYGGAATQNGETYTCPQTGTAVNIASSQAYNESWNNKSYVNYKTSSIRTTVENWYRDNIWKNGQNTAVTNLIADTPYCNDMSEGMVEGDSVVFGAALRVSEYNPQFKCEDNIYGFTVKKGDLTYPVGLLTADEVAYAGGVWNQSNSSYYLYTGDGYWMMSPDSFLGSYAGAIVFYVGSDGALYSNRSVDGTRAAVPAVSLKPEATVKRGTGAYNDPYVINTD